MPWVSEHLAKEKPLRKWKKGMPLKAWVGQNNLLHPMFFKWVNLGENKAQSAFAPVAGENL